MQKVYVTAFLVGLAALFYQLSEILMRHSVWTEFRDPAGVGELLAAGGYAILAVAGALGIDLKKILDAAGMV